MKKLMGVIASAFTIFVILAISGIFKVMRDSHFRNIENMEGPLFSDFQLNIFLACQLLPVFSLIWIIPFLWKKITTD